MSLTHKELMEVARSFEQLELADLQQIIKFGCGILSQRLNPDFQQIIGCMGSGEGMWCVSYAFGEIPSRILRSAFENARECLDDLEGM